MKVSAGRVISNARRLSKQARETSHIGTLGFKTNSSAIKYYFDAMQHCLFSLHLFPHKIWYLFILMYKEWKAKY